MAGDAGCAGGTDAGVVAATVVATAFMATDGMAEDVAVAMTADVALAKVVGQLPLSWMSLACALAAAGQGPG